MKKASIVSIGNELLSGQSVDTNTAYLSGELLSMGIAVVCSYTVGDETGLIVDAIKDAGKRADIILVTGGLGPTKDDITRESVAEYMGVELEFREGLLRDIEEFFAERKIKMTENNKVQAYVPAGAEGLCNRLGTAPGIFAEHEGKIVVCMPGVPIEMKQMFADSVAGRLGEFGAGQVIATGKVKCFGTGESVITERIGEMMRRGRNPVINCTASGGVITLCIVATAQDSETASVMVENDRKELCKVLGDFVYGQDDQTLAEVVGRGLKECGKTVAVAESCTGGLICKLLTDVPGSSDYFMYGWVTYSNEAKITELGVERALIEKYGAVSEEVALAMARGARAAGSADFGVGVSGIAGPGGGNEQKPVGLVYISVASSAADEVQRHVFSHSREHIRLRAAHTALNMLRVRL